MTSCVGECSEEVETSGEMELTEGDGEGVPADVGTEWTLDVK